MLDTDHPIEVPTGGYALKSGIIIGIVAVGFTLATYFAGLMAETWAGYVAMLIVAVLVFIFQKRFRDTMQGGYLRFGKAFGLGVLMYVIVGVLGSIVNYILYTNDPGISESIMEKTYNDLVESGAPTSQIDMTMSMMENMMTPETMVLTTIFTSLIGGLIVSLITSAIVKRNHPMDVS